MAWYNPATWTKAGVQNTAAELIGINDLKKGFKNVTQSGILPGGKKADFGQFAKGVGQTALGAAGFIPVVGTAGRAVIGGAKLATTAAKGSKVLNAALKTQKVAPVVSKVKPIVTTAVKPVTTIAKPVATKFNKVDDFLSTSVIKPKVPTKTKTFVSNALLSPAALAFNARAGIQFGQAFNAAGATPPPATTYQTREPGQYPKGGGKSLGINVAPPSGGGAGGGGGKGPGTPPDTGTTPPGVDPETGIPEIQAPDLGGGDQGGGFGYPGYDQEGGAFTGTGTPGEYPSSMTGQGGNVAGQGGILGAAQVANMNLLAGQSRAAYNAMARDAAAREALSQRIMGVQGGAADIIGGRSQAILGQGITGARRDYVTQTAADTSAALSEQGDLNRQYGSEIAAAYKTAAEKAFEMAKAKSEAAARIRQIGGTA